MQTKEQLEQKLRDLREELNTTIQQDGIIFKKDMATRQEILDEIRECKKQLEILDSEARKSSRIVKKVPDKTIAQSQLENAGVNGRSKFSEGTRRRVKVNL